MAQRFDHKGLCQVQNSFVPDKDLRSRNVIQFTIYTVLPEMLIITIDN